jgi:branched-chain amino acid transport system substrate-binding protein
MRAELRLAGLAAAAALALAASGCGGSRGALKVGVLIDCQGVFSAISEGVLAAAELPFLERGGRPAGPKPSDGIAGAKVGGVPVEIVTGCAEITYLSQLIENVRRLVERDKVDVVVGPMLGETDGLVVRDLARRYPRVTFLLGHSRAQETTLHDPAPNVFRFAPDEAQSTAGLGAYAFHRLGWRRAAVVVADNSQAWPEAAGFIAEFCSLGGRVERIPVPRSGPGAAAARIPADADGVVALARFYGDTARFAAAYAQRGSDLGRHLLLGPDAMVFADRKTLRSLAPLLTGVVMSSFGEYQTTGSAWQAFVRRYAARFRNLAVLDNPANKPLYVDYYTSAEALARALRRSRAGGNALRNALAETAVDGPAGPVRLDPNRQAIVSTYLLRFDPASRSLLPTMKVVPNVEQSFGGYFNARTPPPSLSRPGCHRAQPPAWARG